MAVGCVEVGGVDSMVANCYVSYRRRHVLPRDGPRLPRAAVAYEVRTIPWDKRRARLRGGAVADAGELVLGAARSGEDVEPLRDQEAVVGRAH